MLQHKHGAHGTARRKRAAHLQQAAHCNAGYRAPPLKRLPPASRAPLGEPHDLNVVTDLAALRTPPYILDPAAHHIDMDVVVEPSSRVPLEDLKVEVAAHFHGVSHSQGSRCPYYNSVIENHRSPVSGVEVTRENSIEAGKHCVFTRCDLLRVPLGVASVLLTISSESLSSIKTLRLDAFRMRRVDRQHIATKLITRDDIGKCLSQAQCNGGTLTVAALAMNCGWWHIHTYNSYFKHTDATAFIRGSCAPLPVCSMGLLARSMRTFVCSSAAWLWRVSGAGGHSVWHNLTICATCGLRHHLLTPAWTRQRWPLCSRGISLKRSISWGTCGCTSRTHDASPCSQWRPSNYRCRTSPSRKS